MQRAEYRVQQSRPAFFNLVAWEKAQALAVEAVKLVDALTQTRAANALGNQLVRAAGSIPANIAEGYGRYSEAAYRNHLSIARGSLFEVESWIDLLQRSGFVSEAFAGNLILNCEEVARLLTGTMKPLKSSRQLSVREEGTEYVADA